jgi:hypothetical protein
MQRLLWFAALLTGCATPMGHPRVDFHGSAIAVVPFAEERASDGGLPVIVLSKNGVAGRFLVDTGSSGPMFTSRTIREWQLSVTEAEATARLADGTKARAQLVKNVTVNVSPEITLHWGEVYVSPENNADYFGMIDYNTLKKAHAVIDTRNRTITISP